MAIYYAPFPSNQPQTSLPQWVNGDWWVNPQTRTDGVAGTSTAYKFNTTPVKRWTATTTGVIPPVSTIPPIVASTITSSSQITQGQPVNVYAVNAYGGAAIATSYTSSGTFVGYNVSITPALPAGLTLTKTFSTTTVTDNSGKQWLYNSVDVYVTGTPTGSVTTQSYTLTFTDASGETGSASFSLGVGTSGGSQLSTSVAVASRTLSSGTAATPFTPVIASNGTTPYTFAISPSLSGSGLSFSTANGQISGTPTLIIPTTNYTVTVTDSSSPTQNSSQQFSLTVTGVGLTTATVIPSTTLTQNISFTPFKPVSATGGSGYLTYSVSPSLPSGLTYNSANGFITGTATTAIDGTNFTVTVTDQSNPPQTGTTRTFQLTVAALPALVTTVNTSEVVYNINTSQSIAPVAASGGYGTVSYAISPSLPSGLSFNTTNGVISGTASSAYSRTQFTVTATDSATTPQTSSKSFYLTVSGVALTTTLVQPVVTLYKGADVNYTYGGNLIPVTATGGFGVVTFALTSGTLPDGLTFETSNGRIFGTATTTLANTQFTITATDGTTPVPQTSSKNFYFKTLQPSGLYVTKDGSAAEWNTNPPRHFIVGGGYFVPILRISGGYGDYLPAVISGNNLPLGTTAVISNSGSGSYVNIYGTIPANGYNLIGNTCTITVTDRAGQSVSNTFSYFVDTTLYEFNGYVSHGLIATNNAPFSVSTFGVRGGVAPYTWSNTGALPLGLTLEPTTGAIYGTPRQTTNTIITITATDAAGQTLNNYPYYINVGEPAAITTTTVTPNVSVYFNNGTVSERPVTASGGYGTITFSITPKLPNTLTFLTSNGYIYGIGTQLSANQSYKVTATDIIGQSSNSSFFLETIYTPVSSVKVLPSVTITQYVPGQTFKPINATGGYGSYIYSATLPTGLSIGSANGQISGTPTVTQSATSTTITIQDGVGQTTSNTFLLTIAAPAALNVANNTPLTATYGVPFNRVPVQASGGQGANTYALTSGTLTGTGLSFNTSNGAITGSATALKANSTYRVTVTDSVSQTYAGEFQFGILAPPLTTTLQVPNKTLTEYQSATPFIPVTAFGGYGTYSFSITSGTLPQGLLLNQNSGQIFGTPTALINDEIITIEVEDEAGQTSNQSFNLTVIEASVPALQAVLTQSAYVLNQGQFYSFTPVSGSGGVAPFTYSTVSSLPAGLTLNTSSGELYGTPTEVSNANTIVITVTDSVPQDASKSFEISVLPTPASVDLVGREFSNSAYNHANAAYDLANTLYDQANSCCAHGNSAYDHANSAYDTANSSGLFANASFVTANSAGDFANASFVVANSAAIFANGALEKANSAGDFANGAFVTANSAADFANGAFVAANSAASFANGAFDKANSAAIFANGAFVSANSAESFANGAFVTANSAAIFANAAFAAANSAVGSIAYDTANAAFDRANSSYGLANNALNRTTGGTVSGDVTITGNLIINGTTTTVNTTTVSTTDSLIKLANNNTSGDSLDIGFYGTYNDGSQKYTGLIKQAGGNYFLFNKLTDDPSGNVLTPGSLTPANTATLVANLSSYNITINGVDIETRLQSAYNAANNATDPWVRSQANSAFDKANSAADFANGAFVTANSAAIFANGAFQQANLSSSFANGAFVKANSAAEFANGSFDRANSSYDQANTADVLAQAAYDKANTISEGSTRVTIRGNGTLITDHANSINFIGATVTGTNSGNGVSVIITGGGGGTVDKFELYKFPVGDYGWVTDSIYGGLGDELILNCYDMRVDPECVGLTALDLSS